MILCILQTPAARGEAGAEEVQAEGLLQNPGGGEERQRRGDQEGIQEAGHGPPPGQALRRHRTGEEGSRTKVQRGMCEGHHFIFCRVSYLNFSVV